MTKMNMVDAINLALQQEMAQDKTIVVLGEDSGKEGGVFRVTAGLQKKFGTKRVVDTPLAESAIVGTSIGMAANGLKPIAEIQFSGFIYPGFNQIISHASRIRTRTRGRYTCPMVIRAPSTGGIRALEHHSESMEALFVHMPGVKMVIPSGPYDAKGLLISAIRDPDPVIFFEPKRVYRAIKEEVPDKEYAIPLGKAKVVQQGTDLTLITYGAMLRDVKKALETVDVNVELIDLRTLSPLDDATIIASVKKTGRVLIVHEAPRSCGIGAEIIARINEQALMHLQAPIKRVTGYDTVMPYFQNEKAYIPDAARIQRAIKQVMRD